MSVVPRLASSLGWNDEVPNVELAANIAKRHERRAVRELIGSLRNNDRAIQNDSVQVLYEVGDRSPDAVLAR